MKNLIILIGIILSLALSPIIVSAQETIILPDLEQKFITKHISGG